MSANAAKGRSSLRPLSVTGMINRQVPRRTMSPPVLLQMGGNGGGCSLIAPWSCVLTRFQLPARCRGQR